MKSIRLSVIAITVAASAFAAAATNVTPGQAQQTVAPQRAMPIDQSVQLPELVGNAPRPANVPPGGVAFRVDTIDFIGNTKITTAALQQQAAGLKGKSLTLAEVYAAARDLTRFYQDSGYPLASVNVPVQRVTNGNLLFEVSEGRIGSVRIEGQRFYKLESLQNQASELRSGEVVTTALLERELLLLNDLPGITARLVVMPGAEQGTSDLLIKIEEDAVAFYAGIDNHGREDIGQTRASFNIALNGAGRGDAIDLNFTRSEDSLLSYGRIAYSLPIGTDGGRAEFSYLMTDYENGDPAFAVIDPAGQSYTVRGAYTYPVVRSRNQNRVLSVALSGTHTETYALGALVDSSEVKLIEIAYFGNDVLGDRQTRSWSLGFSGNGKWNSGPYDDEQCCKIFGDYTVTNPVGTNWYSRARVRGAFARDSVSDIDRFSIGGPYSVRGYAASEQRGDSGYDLTAELHRPFMLGKGRAEFLMFADLGQVFTNNVAGGTDQGEILGGIGAGFTAYDVYGFEWNLVAALPVGGYDPADGRRDGRFFFSVGTRF